MSDTPRTDEARSMAFGVHNCDYNAYVYMANHGETLERKLAASKAEVEGLNNILENTRISRDTMIEDRNLLEEELKESNDDVEKWSFWHRKAVERSEKAEAEVERLRGAILQAVNAFDKIPWGYDGDCGSGDIFSFLEDTLNPTDK